MGLAMTADGRDDGRINLEGVKLGMYSFMDVDTTSDPQEDVRPISPATSNEEHPPGSSDKDESEDEEAKAASGGGKRLRGDVDGMAVLNIDYDLADGEVPLPLEIPGGHSLVNTANSQLWKFKTAIVLG